MKSKAALAALFLILVSGCARAPRPPLVAPPAAAPGGFYHTVARGQTVYRIAKTYGVDPKELMRVNAIRDASSLEIGQRLYVPGYVAPPVTPLQPSAAGGFTPEMVRRVVGPPNARSYWRTITVHHSATKQGSAKSFDRDHRRRRMGGLFYHFVIGNGAGMPDGRIEAGWRWHKQVKSNRPLDINICLVGDFSRQKVSEAQLESLANLIDLLRRQYSIPLANVRKHEDIKGKHTACPGKYFPFHRLQERLEEAAARS